MGLIAGEAAEATMSAIVVYQDMDEAQYKRVQDVFDEYATLLTLNKITVEPLPSVDEFLLELKEIVPDIDPMCMVIVEDFIVMTAANGDEVHVVAEATDCLQFTPTGPQIVGNGTWEVVGGTGRFAYATGDGTWEVVAPIHEFGPAGGSGEFTLNFDGVIERGN